MRAENADFAAAANAANFADTPMEGIIYVQVNAAVEGNNPHIRPISIGGLGDQVVIPEGINVVGTLIFDFTNTGDDFYKIFIEVPHNINAATKLDEME